MARLTKKEKKEMAETAAQYTACAISCPRYAVRYFRERAAELLAKLMEAAS